MKTKEGIMENSVAREQYIQDQFRENLEKAVQEGALLVGLLLGITGRSTEGTRNHHELESDLRLAKTYQELLGSRITLLLGALASGVSIPAEDEVAVSVYGV